MELTGPSPIAGLRGSWYLADGKPVPRVSSLLASLSAPQLESWKSREMYRLWQEGHTYQEALQQASEELSARAGFGTAVHQLIHLGLAPKGGVGHVTAAADAQTQLLDPMFPTHSEVRLAKVEGERCLYAGTADLIGVSKRTGAFGVLDWKTGSIGARPFLRHLLQVSLYADATHYVPPGQTELMPVPWEAQTGWIVGLRGDSTWAAHEVDLLEWADRSPLGDATRALPALWTMFDAYGDGSGWAITLEGGRAEAATK